MTINQLVNYKHSLFTVHPLDTTRLAVIKSRCYGGIEYIVKGKDLVLLISTASVANASWELYRTLEGEITPSKNDHEMYSDDMEIINEGK